MSRRALLAEAGVAAVVVGVLAALAWLTVPEACADGGALVDEAEREGIDLLVAGLVAIVSAVGGLFLKRPQDMVRERRAAQGGAEGASGAVVQPVVAETPGKVDAGERALHELEQHEEHCRERTAAIYARIEGVEAKLSAVESKLSSVQSDTSYIRGLMEGRQQRGGQ